MEGTHTEQSHGRTGHLFLSGMARFSMGTRVQTVTLFRLSACAITGIFAGILLFFFFGEHARNADIAETYFTARRFSAFADVRGYFNFLGEWYFHHAVWLVAAILAAFFVYPVLFTSGLVFLRGILAGFGVCVLGGGFSGFTVFYSVMQGLLIAFLMMQCTKSIRYGDDRKRCTEAMRGRFQITRVWFLSEFLPLLSSFFLISMVYICGMTGISAIATWMIK